MTVKELFGELMDFICYGTMSSLKPITISVAVMTALALAATIVGIVSIKRFNKKYRMGEYNDDDDVYSDDDSDPYGANDDSGCEMDDMDLSDPKK